MRKLITGTMIIATVMTANAVQMEYRFVEANG